MRSIRAYRLILTVLAVALTLKADRAYCSQGASSVTAIAVDPQTPLILYAATSDSRLLKSSDGGATWNATGLVTSAWIAAVAIDPQTPTIVYSAYTTDHGSGVFKTFDGGMSWTASENGLRYLNATGLAIDAQISTTVYLVASGGLYKSTDGSRTWNQVLFPPPLVWVDSASVVGVAVDPLNSQILYASVSYYAAVTEAGDPEREFGQVFKSIDGGAHWYCILCADWWSSDPFPRPIGPLAIAPPTSQNPATVYAADFYSPAVFKTVDDGSTWSALTIAPDTCCASLQHLAVDAHNPAIVYASIVDVGVFRSVDGGASWTAAMVGLPDIRYMSMRAFAIDPQNPAIVYLGTSLGLFKSTDAGVSWNSTGLVQHSPLSSLTLDPTSVAAGAPVTGTVRLMTAAPAGGVTVIVSADNSAAATVPTTVTVPAGATTATFMISTGVVANYVWVTISVCHDDAIRSAQFLVNAQLTPSSLSVYPSSVTARATANGLLILSADAPAVGAVIELSSSDPAVAAVPASVTVPAWDRNAWFTISTGAVTASATVTISATHNGVRTSAKQSVNPAVTLASLAVSTTAVNGGSPSTGVVTLTSAAAAGGVSVVLSSSNAGVASVPATVIVAAGATSASFAVLTNSSCLTAMTTISATYAGVTKTTVLTVTPGPSDTIAIDRADYSRKWQLLRVSATSSISTATLQVFVTSSGQLIGGLINDGGGRYSREFTWPTNPASVLVRSSSCGSATRQVSVKSP